VAEARLRQRIEQHVAVFDHAVALAHDGIEERTDACLEEHVAPVEPCDEQAAARQRNAVLFVGLYPARPHGARRVAEHRTAVQALRIADQ